MPSKEKRVRVERGLYRVGDVFYACATPRGGRSAMWKSLGRIGIMEARRRRDRFAAEVQMTQPALLDARCTFAEIAGEWIAEQRTRVAVGEMSIRTFDIYEVGLRLHVLPRLGSRQVRSITPDDLVAWIRGMRAAGFAPHSVHNYWAALHLVMRYAVRRGVISGNPADRLTSAERPKPGSSRHRFLSREEMERLLEAAPERYRVVIAWFSGLRLGELLGLTWGDVDFAREVLHVHTQMAPNGKVRPLKTAAARRDVVLIAPLAHELRQLRVATPFPRERDLVFCATTGGTIGHRNLSSRGLTRACERSGLEGVTFHVLRHTFASILIAQGHDVVFVSRQLGHASAAITLKVYAHLFDAERHADEARARLEADYGALFSRAM